MNCQGFENIVNDLARQRPVEASALEQSLAHSESCATCALRLEKERTLTVGLRTLAEEMKVFKPSDRIEKQLAAAFRERTPLPRHAHATNQWRYLVMAAAAVLLIAFGIIGLRLRPAPSPSLVSGLQNSVEPETLPQVAPDVGTISPPVLSSNHEKLGRAGNRTAHRRVAKHRPKMPQDSSVTSAFTPTAIANVPASEVTTEFMPLGDVGVADLQEGAQVVRVEMPRYAMARFGFPVNMERYDEMVKADVWVGVDGLVRAIRFVQ